MKIQVRSILFALVLPVTACGGDEAPTVDFKLSDYVSVQPLDAQPVSSVEAPVSPVVAVQPVEVVKPTTSRLEELLKADKKNVDVQIELARIYISMNEKGKAVAAANRAVKLAPLSSQAWNTKGRAELTAHNYDTAIEAFTKAVEINPDNVFAWNNLGYTELLLKKYDDAVQHLTEATSRPGATGYMFNNLGTALEHVDKLDDARLAYEAGGKLGSREAASSRKRLEGVDTIVVESVATVTPVAPVTPKVQEYDTTNEGDVEPDTTDVPGTGSSDEDGSTTETPVESNDHATM